MVSMASCSPEPPHIQPPIAQVPRPIRDGFSPVPAISIVSMAHLPVDSAQSRCGPGVGGLLSGPPVRGTLRRQRRRATMVSLLAVFLTFLSGAPVALGADAPETDPEIVAAAVRARGFPCDRPQSVERDSEASSLDFLLHSRTSKHRPRAVRSQLPVSGSSPSF